MKNHLRLKGFYIFLLLICVLSSILPGIGDSPIYASQPPGTFQYKIPDSDARTITVGFSRIPGICQVDAYGVHTGLLVDYLNEIAKYNNWDYEYIEYDPDLLVDSFMAGEFDLMGGTYYSPDLAAYAAYPKYSMGNSRAVLLCRVDDPEIKSYELTSLNGKTIGVYGPASEKLQRLKDFLQLNNLQCEIRIFTAADMAQDGNLYRFLKSGEVDLLLGNEAESGNDFRIAAEFAAQPYYIVARAGDSELLDGLNLGLEKILDSEPKFSEERYEDNFRNVGTTGIWLSETELSYIASRDSITVAAVRNWHPFHCVNSNLDHHNGILPDLLQNISEFTGLSFNYIFTDSYEEAVELVKTRKADILGYYLDSEESAANRGLALTRSYMSLNNVIVKNKSTNYPSDGLVAGILNGRTLPPEIPASQILYYDSPSDCLKAVNTGEVDFLYGLSSSIEQEMQLHRYSNVIPISSINNSLEIGFAMDRPVDTYLLTILNKAIGNMSAEEQHSLTDRNMVSMGYSSMPLGELIYANPVAFIVIFSAFILLATISLLSIMRARLRNSLIQSELEKAEAKSRAKGEFLSRMSHEIRTPMNAIMGLANLTCMEEQLPVQVESNLKKILSSSQYLLALINDILDMSRIENGKMEIESEAFSLHPLLADLESMMRAQAESKQIHLSVDFKLVHPCIEGDPVRLRQVLVNLLSNAVKFTPEGGLVQLSVHEIQADDTTVSYRFSVKDNGIGIPTDYQKRIFDSFEQLGSSSAKSAGTGLGLPISQTIVNAMGGELELKSVPGEGSEFFFLLQFLQTELPEEALAEQPADKESLLKDLKGIRILLAEDNDLNAEIATELLQMQGAQVDRESDGLKAFTRFTASPPGHYHVILMDIRMPVMDGLEATCRIRSSSHPDSASIPIIAMTANSFKEDSDAAAQAGMTGFVSKPVDLNYLFEVLRQNIRLPDS